MYSLDVQSKICGINSPPITFMLITNQEIVG